MKKETLPRPPLPEKETHCHTDHGRLRNDPYYWMRLTEEQRNAKEPDQQTSRVIEHLTAENAYTEAVLGSVTGMRSLLYREMKARIKETDMSVPYRENGYWYRSRFEEGTEYPVHMRAVVGTDREQEPEEYVDFLDENAMAKGHAYFDLADLEVAPGNRLLAYSLDLVGRRRYEIRFRDLDTGTDLPDVLVNADDGGAFADDDTFFYVRKDKTLRNAYVFRHVMGTEQGQDVEVFHEKNPAFYCDVYRSRSDKFVIITSESTLSSEHRLLRTDDPFGTFQVLFPRERRQETSIMHVSQTGPSQPSKFYIHTNWKARNFRLMECLESDTTRNSWKEVIPHRADVMLEDVDAFKDHLVLTERSNGLVHLRVISLRTSEEHEIAFNDPAYVAYSSINAEWDSPLFRYGYTSLTTPTSVLAHDLNAATDILLKQQEVVGGFNALDYVSERVWARAKDGRSVPISLVYHKDTVLEGQAPLLLCGYGSYGINVEPVFSSARLSLLDRGFVVALAHVRGGEELGRSWYEEGRMEKKMNTFTDFIACAEHLLQTGHADPKRLFCMGGSAGGLLVGAVINLRPDLWNGAVAEVPFVDVVNTMLDASLPLTSGEYDEWGDPREKEAFERMLGYSPYDNVHEADYPALLVTTGFHDSQVQYWEPEKWISLLREHQKGDRPLLLWTNMGAGHGGSSGRYERLKEVAMIYAFLLQRAGIQK